MGDNEIVYTVNCKRSIKDTCTGCVGTCCICYPLSCLLAGPCYDGSCYCTRWPCSEFGQWCCCNFVYCCPCCIWDGNMDIKPEKVDLSDGDIIVTSREESWYTTVLATSPWTHAGVLFRLDKSRLNNDKKANPLGAKYPLDWFKSFEDGQLFIFDAKPPFIGGVSLKPIGTPVIGRHWLTCYCDYETDYIRFCGYQKIGVRRLRTKADQAEQRSTDLYKFIKETSEADTPYEEGHASLFRAECDDTCCFRCLYKQEETDDQAKAQLFCSELAGRYVLSTIENAGAKRPPKAENEGANEMMPADFAGDHGQTCGACCCICRNAGCCKHPFNENVLQKRTMASIED
eukprot:UN29282